MCYMKWSIVGQSRMKRITAVGAMLMIVLALGGCQPKRSQIAEMSVEYEISAPLITTSKLEELTGPLGIFASCYNTLYYYNIFNEEMVFRKDNYHIYTEEEIEAGMMPQTPEIESTDYYVLDVAAMTARKIELELNDNESILKIVKLNEEEYFYITTELTDTRFISRYYLDRGDSSNELMPAAIAEMDPNYSGYYYLYPDFAVSGDEIYFSYSRYDGCASIYTVYRLNEAGEAKKMTEFYGDFVFNADLLESTVDQLTFLDHDYSRFYYLNGDHFISYSVEYYLDNDFYLDHPLVIDGQPFAVYLSESRDIGFVENITTNEHFEFTRQGTPRRFLVCFDDMLMLLNGQKLLFITYRDRTWYYQDTTVDFSDINKIEMINDNELLLLGMDQTIRKMIIK